MVKIGDGSDVDLIFEELGSFRSLPRGLRSGKVFDVVRTLRSTVPSF
jgi:hypothetical protein